MLRSLARGLTLFSVLFFIVSIFAADTIRRPSAGLDCGMHPTGSLLQEYLHDVAAGRILSPAFLTKPVVVRSNRVHADVDPYETKLTGSQIFSYEDSASLLLTDFTEGQLLNLMTQAANAMISTHGDNFDFVGYWINFVPDHQIGAAFYSGAENTVSGLGLSLFNDRPAMGLAGDHVEGYIMMWNINTTWVAGDAANSRFTRLALAQEFEHRWGMFLPPLLDGRPIQGNNGSCGRRGHWNFRVDGQGSGMELGEWVGPVDAFRQSVGISYNTDNTGVFSFSDLYLMGYASPSEMDAGNGEMRYMDTSVCLGNYSDNISTITSADIAASAGPRVPDSDAAQKNFRAGWIMIHLPGDEPDAAELTKVVSILDQHVIDWAAGTLGRGSMSDALFSDCNGNGVDDAQDLIAGTSLDVNSDSIPDDCRLPCNDPNDSDGDGIGDSCDNCPLIVNTGQRDADDDGLGDPCDNCVGASNRIQLDRDGDGFGDRCDTTDFNIDLYFGADKNRPRWQVERNFVSTNLYRGDLSVLKAGGDYLQVPASNPLAAQFCALTQPDFTDGIVVAEGEAAFYLVSATAPSGIQRFLGNASNGTPRPFGFRCP